MQTIQLKEYDLRTFDRDALDEDAGRKIWLKFRDKVEIDPPTFLTSNQWQIKPKGWVGHIPIDNSFSIIIKPKVELGNLFRMLEYAYRIPFIHDDDLIKSDALPEFYQRLANILAKQVIRRTFRGLYKEYISRSDRLPFVRGRINTRSMIDKHWQVELDCRYQENTSDNPENQILAWTLFCIARTGLCQGDVKKRVHQAYRGVYGFSSLMPVCAADCAGRNYNRLNCDYEPMHALCRFFLEVTGPSQEVGNRSMLPFLIDMPRLYEAFVAEWLKEFLGKNYPGRFRLKAQAPLKIGHESNVEFRIDLVLEDMQTGKPICLMDTKYKVQETPSADDLQQVIAYAKALGCNEAFLIYPNTPKHPFSATVGEDTYVQALTFALDGDLEENGRLFLEQLKHCLGEPFTRGPLP